MSGFGILKMIVKAIEIRSEILSLVLCETLYGKATLTWKGCAPQVGETYDVELETAHVFVWGRDVMETTGPISIQDTSDGIKVIGEVESVDGDGYTVLRMGNNIFPILVTGGAPHLGTYVVLTVQSLEAYPIN